MQKNRPALVIVLASLTALAVAMGIGRFAFTPMLPLMQADAGLSLARGSTLAFANYTGYLVGALVAARATFRPEGLLRGGLILVVAATALMAAPLDYPVWLILRFGAGIASAWVLVATASISMARLAELERSALAGMSFAGVGAGIFVAGLLCAAVAACGGSSREGWGVLAAAAALGSAFVWPRLRAGTTAVAETRPAVMTASTRSGHGGLIVCYGLAGFGYSLPATFLPAQARALVADPAVFSWVWPVFGLAALISTLAGSLLEGHVPRRRLWAGAQWVMAAGVLLPQWRQGLGALLAAALCVGGTFMLLTMLGMQEARAVAGRQAQNLMARMTAAFAFGQLCGPLLVGAAAAAAMSPALIAWLAGLGLMAGTLALLRQPGAPT